MAVRINLLPYRKIRRAERQRQFNVMLVGTLIAGVAVVFMGNNYISGQIEAQTERNTRLENAIAQLDKEIAEINKLKDEIQALLARKAIIETLQADRAQTVHLLDELVRQTPEGVYLKSLTQKGLRVQVVGYAQSNARVSTLMRNIESSPWLANPGLVEVRAGTVEKRRLAEFNLNFQLKRAEVKDAAKDAGKNPKPAAKKG